MARTKRSEPAKIDFEASLKRLEEIVRRLEDEQVPLEESLRLFAEGKRLARACSRELDGAELRIRELTEAPSGEIREADFEESPDSEPEAPAARGDAAPPGESAPTGEKDDFPF